MGKFSEYKQ
jgi:surface protein